MPKYFYVACDGGLQNTIAGAGGILEIRLDKGYHARYHEFPDGMGASPHFLKQSPNRKYLVMSCGNSGQIYVFGLTGKGDAYDIENPIKVLNHFNTLCMPEHGPDGTTDFFDFWGEGPSDEDSDHIVTHYNRLLIKVNIHTGKLSVLHDLAQHAGKEGRAAGTAVPRNAPRFLHQVTVKGDYIVVDDALGECIFVLRKASPDRADLLYCSGDGYTGGHHCLYEDAEGRLKVARPSFNFQTYGAILQLQDNTLSVYTLSEDPAKREVKTFSYAYHMPNHAPVDLFVEGRYLYGAYGIPGSVLKFDLETGRIVASYLPDRPWWGRRIRRMLSDYVSWHLNHGTSLKQFDRTTLDLKQHMHAVAIGMSGGSRAGFFALAPDPEENVVYACHRGNNRLYCLDKETLAKKWEKDLPRARRDFSLFHTFVFRWSGYLAKGLGTHHGKIVSVGDRP
jgi:hypothetical protein